VIIVSQAGKILGPLGHRIQGETVMTDPTAYPEDDPRHHTAHLRTLLQGVVSHAREDIGKIGEPKAQALFETTAEVCTGLIKAFDDYDKKAPAWR
jgi:hypothetical protein